MRSVPEWIGKTDDSDPPATVKARVWLRYGGCCAKTGRKLRPGDAHQYDHILPLADGGQNRESNLQLLSVEAHKQKTAKEKTDRSKADRIARKHRGEWPAPARKMQSRPFPKSRGASQ